ncbi:MAG: HAD family hydrolase [Candidatus Binatia bacterium]
MKDIALFDLDGTLVDLKIDANEFEWQRCFWASYLKSVGVSTTLRPLLPELRRIAHTPLGRGIKGHILRSFDELELAAEYCCLGDLEMILQECRSRFRKLAVVTHNSGALWKRLASEQGWPGLFDAVITRDDMSFFKPDSRTCDPLFRELTPMGCSLECWVIGNSDADRDLGLNLHREHPSVVVRTVMIEPTANGNSQAANGTEFSIKSVGDLLHLLQDR